MIYTSEQLAALVKQFVEVEADLLKIKEADYAVSRQDRLIQFRQIAEMESRTMSSVACTLLLKHVQSLVLAAQTQEFHWGWENLHGGEGLKQKIADARNYLMLAAACFEAEYQEWQRSKALTKVEQSATVDKLTTG